MYVQNSRTACIIFQNYYVYHFKAISFKKNDVESASITNHKKKEL